ncbi:hypothetical protein KRIGEM_02709 [Komagataeibacter rhaeticus]|nr:hypothetical protein KRIGEM_02709 [Komagataeibacter rhaeticus]
MSNSARMIAHLLITVRLSTRNHPVPPVSGNTRD